MGASYRITLDFQFDMDVVEDQFRARALADHICRVLYNEVEPVVDVNVWKVEKLD